MLCLYSMSLLSSIFMLTFVLVFLLNLPSTYSTSSWSIRMQVINVDSPLPCMACETEGNMVIRHYLEGKRI